MKIVKKNFVSCFISGNFGPRADGKYPKNDFFLPHKGNARNFNIVHRSNQGTIKNNNLPNFLGASTCQTPHKVVGNGQNLPHERNAQNFVWWEYFVWRVQKCPSLPKNLVASHGQTTLKSVTWSSQKMSETYPISEMHETLYIESIYLEGFKNALAYKKIWLHLTVRPLLK